MGHGIIVAVAFTISIVVAVLVLTWFFLTLFLHLLDWLEKKLNWTDKTPWSRET